MNSAKLILGFWFLIAGLCCILVVTIAEWHYRKKGTGFFDNISSFSIWLLCYACGCFLAFRFIWFLEMCW